MYIVNLGLTGYNKEHKVNKVDPNVIVQRVFM